MIVLYFTIYKWIEIFEWIGSLSNTKPQNGQQTRGRGNGESFVWFDHFYADNHTHNNQPEGDNHDANDNSFDSPDW